MADKQIKDSNSLRTRLLARTENMRKHFTLKEHDSLLDALIDDVCELREALQTMDDSARSIYKQNVDVYEFCAHCNETATQALRASDERLGRFVGEEK